VFDLTKLTLSAKISQGSTLLDSEMIADGSVDLTEDLTISPNQLYSSENFKLSSTTLNGLVVVTTTQTFKRIADPALTRARPYTGQFIAEGSGGVRVRVTVMGDETYVPPAGQGQIEIEIDSGTGNFGTHTWANWDGLTPAAPPSGVGGTGGSGSGGTGASGPYTIGGVVSGLSSGASLVLEDNGTDPLTVAANGSFQFLTALAGGKAYSVSVVTQPAGETCTVMDGSGTVGSANVANVAVTCQ
jgi:hypothetical protein